MDFDGLRHKAEDLLEEHADQVEKGIDKAEQFAKDKIEGHDDQIDKAADKLRGLLPHDDKPAGT